MVAGQVAVEHWEKQMSWAVAGQVAAEHWEQQMSWAVAGQVAVEHWEKQMSWAVAGQVAVEHWEIQMKLEVGFLPVVRGLLMKESVLWPLVSVLAGCVASVSVSLPLCTARVWR